VGWESECEGSDMTLKNCVNTNPLKRKARWQIFEIQIFEIQLPTKVEPTIKTVYLGGIKKTAEKKVTKSYAGVSVRHDVGVGSV